MATKSAKIRAQIAALEAAAAAAAEEEKERMRARVVRAAERAGLLNTTLSTRDLETAFRNAIYYKIWQERLPGVVGAAEKDSDEQREGGSYE